jgi:acetyl esterase/lipase
MPKVKALIGATKTVLCSHLSPIGLINLTLPRSGYVVHEGLAYGAGPRQRLDIYVPQPLTAPAPVLLFFYGGAWQSGHRSHYRAFGQAFASAGLVTAVADYRLYPRVKYPSFVEDAAGALVWVHDHIAQYGGDRARIFIAGHSAGAYNAVMLASEPRFLTDKGGSPSWIKGVIGIAGPYDFLPMRDPVYVDIFHGTNNTDSMPVYHVDGPRSAMLLVTGAGDRTVRPSNTDSMAARLRSVGSPVKVVRYKRVGHVGVILSLVRGFRGIAGLRRDMLDFIHSQ